MPELPEVETVRRGAAAHLPGRRLRGFEARRRDLRLPIPGDALRGLAGRRCTGVGRRSKYLIVELGGPAVLVHLGMSGSLAVDVVGGRAPRPPWGLHEHWRLDFGTRLVRLTDPRRFGLLDVAEPPVQDHRLLAKLGPEPLEPEFDGAWLYTRSRGRRVAVKGMLMEAATVVGVGNIYASESCFRAGVRPRRAAGRLTRRECDRLADGVRATLDAAIRAGGTTLRDHRGVDAGAGWFQRELAVYGRGGEPCTRCASAVRRVLQGSRATYYCPGCQR